jgi:hypothetical protein
LDNGIGRNGTVVTGCGIRSVVLQSTGVYWIAVYDILQSQGLEVNLVDARGTKNVPGRKSDVQECQWLLKIAHLWSAAGLLFALAKDSWRTHDVAVAGPACQRCRAGDPTHAEGAD